MIVMTEEGWRGADGKFYDCLYATLESFPKRFDWPKPTVSERDKVEERPLQVFLSYAKEDKRVIRELYNLLTGINVSVWFDEEKLLPGQKWRDEISRAIRSSDAFLPCLSKVAVSKVGFINREFKEAMEIADEQPEGKIFIIPIRLQETEVPERFREIQWVNYYDKKGFLLLQRSLVALAQWLREHGSEVAMPTSSVCPAS